MPGYAPPSDPSAPLQDPVAEAESRAARWGGKAFAEAASITDPPTKDAYFDDPAADMSENELQAGTGQVCPATKRSNLESLYAGGSMGHTSTTLADRNNASRVGEWGKFWPSQLQNTTLQRNWSR